MSASGAGARLGLNVVHFPAQALLQHLKAARAAAGVTLADLPARPGIDQPARSRLENGHTQKPTLDNSGPYAAAVGKSAHRISITAIDAGHWVGSGG